jgi:hypothetical protein
MAPKGSPLITKWKQEFELAIKMGLLEYKIHQLLPTGLQFSMFNEHLADVYLVCQAALQKILQQARPKPRVLLLSPSETMFKIHATCSARPNRIPEENTQCVQNMLLKDPSSKKLPYIKLRGPNRDNLNLEPYFSTQE